MVNWATEAKKNSELQVSMNLKVPRYEYLCVSDHLQDPGAGQVQHLPTSRSVEPKSTIINKFLKIKNIKLLR